jgi:LuxR family transcriptional regulator, maltose regulon positive regulatory protein
VSPSERRAAKPRSGGPRVRPSDDFATVAHGSCAPTALALVQAQLHSGPVWIDAPAGWGKSQLLDALAAQTPHHTLRLRLDENASSVQAFMARLADAAGHSGWTVPLVQEEGATRAELERRARPFIEQFFARLPQPILLLVDDAHAAGHSAQSLLSVAADALPSGCRLVVASRAAPHGTLATNADRRWRRMSIADAPLDRARSCGFAPHASDAQLATLAGGAAGQFEQTAATLFKLGDFAALAQFLLTHAPAMQADGRRVTWLQWFAKLPQPAAQNDPWLAYWQAAMWAFDQPAHCRSLMHEALRKFQDKGDARGQLLACVAIVDSHYLEWEDFSAFEWIGEQLNQALITIDPKQIDPATALAVHSRQVLLQLFVGPNAFALQAAVEATQRALGHDVRDIDRFCAAKILLAYWHWRGLGSDAAERLITDFEPLAERDDLPPALRIRWFAQVAARCTMNHQAEQAKRAVARARVLAREYDLPRMVFEFQHAEVRGLIANNELASARQCLDAIQQSLRQHRQLDTCYFLHLEATWFARANDFATAVDHALSAVRLGRERGLPAIQRAQMQLMVACMHTGLGQFGSADAWYERALSSAYGIDKDVILDFRQLTQAYALLLQGVDADGLRLLATALTQHSARQAAGLLKPLPRIASYLADRALAHGIEIEHVRQCIVRQGLSPPDDNSAEWPWPQAIRGFGRVGVFHAGQPTARNARVPKTQQTLLALLLSAGPAGVDREAVCDELWSDDDLMTPIKTFEVTVHRLRRWLGGDETVTMRGGRVALDPGRVWTDVWAFDRLREIVASQGHVLPPARLQELCRQVLILYRGGFCEGVSCASVVAAREKYRRLFIDVSQRLAALLEAGALPASAIAFAEAAQRLEPGASTLRLPQQLDRHHRPQCRTAPTLV